MIKTHILQVLDELKASDVTTLNVEDLTTVTEHMIVCTGRSTRHVKSMGQHVIQAAKSMNVDAYHVEGLEHGEWVLVDLNDTVVHIMVAEARAFYQLEKLWSEHWNDDFLSE